MLAVLTCTFLVDFSQPLSAAISKWHFQICLLAVAAFFLVAGFVGIQRVRDGSAFEASIVRFRVLGLRAGKLSVTSARISDFGLLINGCRLSLPADNVTIGNNSDGTTAIVRTEAARGANGYYFVTCAGACTDHDPVRWSVEVAQTSSINGSAFGWRAVGASVWRRPTWPWSEAIDMYPDMAYPTPSGRLEQVAVDQSLTWCDIVEWIVLNLFMTAGYTAAAGLGAYGRGRSVRWLSVAVFAAHVALRVCGVAGLLLNGAVWAEREAVARSLEVSSLTDSETSTERYGQIHARAKRLFLYPYQPDFLFYSHPPLARFVRIKDWFFRLLYQPPPVTGIEKLSP